MLAAILVAVTTAACGSSSGSTPTGYIRVANLAPDTASIDFCVGTVGGTLSAPVMAGAGSPEGIIYDAPASSTTAGLKQMSKYFGYAPGTYTVAIKSNAAGGSCASPLASATVTVTDGGYGTVTFNGKNGAANAAHSANAFVDEVSVGMTSVALRFVNAGLLYNDLIPPGPFYTAAPPVDIGYLSGTTYTKLFSAVTYPGKAAAVAGGVDANGYLTIPTSGLPSPLTLTVCQAGVTPPDPYQRCSSASIPTASVQGGIVASAYIAGIASTDPVTVPSTAGALFCGDVTGGSTIAAFGNYSACTSKLN